MDRQAEEDKRIKEEKRLQAEDEEKKLVEVRAKLKEIEDQERTRIMLQKALDEEKARQIELQKKLATQFEAERVANESNQQEKARQERIAVEREIVESKNREEVRRRQIEALVKRVKNPTPDQPSSSFSSLNQPKSGINSDSDNALNRMMNHGPSQQCQERNETRLGPCPSSFSKKTSFGPDPIFGTHDDEIMSPTESEPHCSNQGEKRTLHAENLPPEKRISTDEIKISKQKNTIGVRQDLFNPEVEEQWKKYFDKKFDQVMETMLLKDSLTTSEIGNKTQERIIVASNETDVSTDTTVRESNSFKRDLEEIQDKRILAKYSKSLEELKSHLPHYKDIFETEESKNNAKPTGVVCEKCTESIPDYVLNNPEVNVSGKITYDASQSVYENNKLTREFRQFKSKVNDHEMSNIHKSHVEQALVEEHRPVTEEEKQAALNCSRAAYKAVKDHQSQNEYERELAFMSACGSDIGDINHSRSFAEKMTTAFHAVLTERTKEILQTVLPSTGLPPPVAVVADKVTLNHRTYQVVGLSAPIEGEMATIFAEMTPVKDHTADGLANDMFEKISTLIPIDEIPKRLVGGATDGQYIRMGVNRSLDNTLNNPTINK